MIINGLGLIRATTSTGRMWPTRVPVRKATIAVVTGAKGNDGSPMKCSKLLSITFGASLKSAVVHHCLHARIAGRGQQ